MELSTQERADLVTARETLRRAALGYDDLDFVTTASMLDRVLASTCPHDTAHHHTSEDSASGRPLTTCPECGVSWFSDYTERLTK